MKNESSASNWSEKNKEIADAITNWETFAHEQIKKGLEVRRYIYDSDYEKSLIQTKGSIKDTEKVTLSPLRTASNRIKTDLRDLQPFFNVSPILDVSSDKSQKVFGAILDKIIFHDKNQSALFGCFDDLVDVGICALKINCEYSYNRTTKSIKKDAVFEKVTNLLGVYFDTNVSLENVNESGKKQGFYEEVEIDGRMTVVGDHFEKIFKKTKYGKRFDASSKKFITEEISPEKKYQVEIEVDDLVEIRHYVLHDQKIISEEVWPYTEFPFVLGVAVHLNDSNYELGKRLSLVPFCEHVIPAQISLNYAATLNVYNIKMTRSTTKAKYAVEMIKGHEAKWKNRNAGEDDLPFNLLRGPDGSIVPLSPEFIPDAPVSAQISEAMQNYPTLINALLGTNMEQDITYNQSGEAIRQMQMVRHKNAKLYTDKFLEFLGSVGKGMEYFIPAFFDEPQFITIDNYGTPLVVPINTNAKNGYNIKKMFDTYQIKIDVGSAPVDQKTLTLSSLNQYYQVLTGTPLGPQIIANTIDIYAAALDTPEANEIARRTKLAMPQNILQLEDGKITDEQIIEQNAQQQAQGAQQQAQAQEQAQATQAMDNQAKMLTAQSKIKTADNRLTEAALDSSAETAKALNSKNL